ncbi:MAG: sigma-70 family RNA polymerase sigma factor, partial [Bdellovibrionales bacterium]|nr:sigma-70 family RNA polymerase sigma factor [Bdellovibrionales bacterium]
MSSQRGIQKYRQTEARTSRSRPAVAATAVTAPARKSAKKPATAHKGKVIEEEVVVEIQETTTVVSANGEQVNQAIEDVVVAEAAAKEEVELQKELEKELEQDKRHTSRLVSDDFNPGNRSRDQLILEYSPLIKYIAQKIAARLPANIELDDLISSGVIGLMDAIDKYDCSRDNKFKTYAEFRIRGAILDELRAQDWVPRSVREKAKQLERVYVRIEQEKGRQATDEEVCEALGVNMEEYQDMLTQVRSVSLLSFDDVSNFSKADKRSLHGLDDNGPRAPSPFNQVNVAFLKRLIADAINDLPEKQRLV